MINLWSNRGCKQGYTIVESMLFLVITATLLISALAVFQGRHARTEFTQAVRETEARLRTVINEVGSGQFPEEPAFSCQAAIVGGERSTQLALLENDGPRQGTNQDCIFLGKAIQFGTFGDNCDAASLNNPSVNNVDQCNTFRVFTVAGLRQTGTGSEVLNFSQARPAVSPDLSDDYRIPGGLFVKRVALGEGNSSVIAYLQALSGGSANDLVSGSPTPNLYSLVQARPGVETPAILEAFGQDDFLNSSNENPRQGVIVCLSNGSRDAAIHIGADGRPTSSQVIIDSVPEVCNVI